MLTTLGVLINASSILVLYLLVYTLFYKCKSFEKHRVHFEEYKQSNDSRLKNLVYDVNHNDQLLKHSFS